MQHAEYLDDYGIDPITLAALIGAGSTIIGAGGGLLKGRQARQAQQEAIAAEKKRMEQQRVIEEQKLRQRNTFLLVGTALAGIAIVAYVRAEQ